MTVFLSLRQNRAECAGNPDGLIQLLNRPLDIVVRLEHRVRVKNELDIRVELTSLTLDRRRLADRLSALNRNEINAMVDAERLRASTVRSRAAVVDQDDLTRPECLPNQRRQTEHDVIFFVERRNDHVDLCLRQFSAGVGLVGSGPRRSQLRLSTCWDSE